MENKLKQVMLVDDSRATNFFNKKMIERTGISREIVVAENGAEAIEYITSGKNDTMPQIIFLDLNMPVMNGWEFLEAYSKLGSTYRTAIIVLMIGTDLLTEDKERIKKYDFIKADSTKMLDKKFLTDLVKDYFCDLRLLSAS